MSALADLRERAESILTEVEKAIVGKRAPWSIRSPCSSDGHVLLEGSRPRQDADRAFVAQATRSPSSASSSRPI